MNIQTNFPIFRFHHFIEVVWIIVLFWLLSLGTSPVACWRTPLVHFFIGFLFPLTITILDAQCWHHIKILKNNFMSTVSHSREDGIYMIQHLEASCAEEKPTVLLPHTVTYFGCPEIIGVAPFVIAFSCLHSSPPLEINKNILWLESNFNKGGTVNHTSFKQIGCPEMWASLVWI